MLGSRVLNPLLNAGIFRSPLRPLLRASVPSSWTFRANFHTSSRLLATYYEVLGVEAGSSQAAISNAYREKVKIWHPDKNKSPKAAETFVAIQRAYNVLRDPKQRKDYDALLKATAEHDMLLTNRGDQVVVVKRKRGWGTTIFWTLVASFLIYKSWNTWHGSQEESKQEREDYLKNPRLFEQTKGGSSIER